MKYSVGNPDRNLKGGDYNEQIKKNFTSDELQEMYGFNRRRLERMMSILVEQFGDKIETVENSTDRKNILDLKKEQLIH